jgi:hypothetical protein
MTSRIFLIFLSAMFTQVHGQLPLEGFLNSAFNDTKVRMVNEQVQFLSTSPYRLSPLQRVEFRTQNRELLGYQQEFGLRFVAANPWEVRNSNLFFKSYRNGLDLEQSLALKDALHTRYQAAIDFMYYRALTRILSLNKLLIARQLSVLKEQAGSKFFDADDFVDLQLDEMDATVEFDEAQFALQEQLIAIEAFYGQTLPDSLQWTMDSAPLPSALVLILDSLTSANEAPLFVRLRKEQLSMAESEYKMEKSNVNAGFLQTDYDHRREVQGRTPFNISLGVTIPLVNPNKGDMARRHVDVIESRYEIDEAQTEHVIETSRRIARLKNLAGQYKVLQTKISGYEGGSMAAVMSALEGGDPRITIRFNANILKLKILHLKMHRDALLTYISSLYTTDRLQVTPLVNYLDADLPVIK